MTALLDPATSNKQQAASVQHPKSQIPFLFTSNRTICILDGLPILLHSFFLPLCYSSDLPSSNDFILPLTEASPLASTLCSSSTFDQAWPLTDGPGAEALSRSCPLIPSVLSIVLVQDKVSAIQRPSSQSLTRALAARIPSRDELHDRAQSSLSCRCDPQDQLPASPGPTYIQPATVAASPEQGSSKKIENDTKDEGASEEAESDVPELNRNRRRSYRSRPLSWLPFSRSSSRPRYPRSRSVQLPKASSTSTVARSVISAPILTSTTNTEVARSEGVHCGEISDLAFSQSTWNSQVGWIAKSADNQGNGKSSHKAGDHGQTSERKEMFTDVPERVRGRIQRLGAAIRSRIRSAPLRTQHAALHQEQSEDTGEIHSPALERGLSRRRAEARNLYKGKIKGLTGNGHVRRKSVNDSKESPVSQQDPPLLGDEIVGTLPDPNGDPSDNDSAFGSLTRSFTSAVDKLDFYSPLPRNMSFLRSKSSFFSSKKGDKGDKGGRERGDSKRPFPTISPPQLIPQPTLSTSAPFPESPSKSTPQQVPPTASQTKKSDEQYPPATSWPLGPPLANRQGLESSQDDLGIRQTVPSPMVFSDMRNAYVPSAPASGYPRGVNPLRMHPPDTMAIAPSLPYRPLRAGPSNTNTPPSFARRQVATPSRESDDDDSLGSLEDAPIYSPSLGDLSQYARDTPPSTKSGRSQAQQTPGIGATPTRSILRESIPPEGQRGFLRKSRSGLGLFNRTRPDKTSMLASDGTGSARPGADSPLSQRDTNRKAAGKSVKKSRSLHFGGLFRKESQSDLVPPMPTGPFQPTTPSPLRNVTRARGDDGSQSTSTEERSPGLRASKK